MLTLRYNEPVFILMLRGRVGCLRLFVVTQGFLTVKASRPHSDGPDSAGLLRTSDQPDAESST